MEPGGKQAAGPTKSASDMHPANMFPARGGFTAFMVVKVFSLRPDSSRASSFSPTPHQVIMKNPRMEFFTAN